MDIVSALCVVSVLAAGVLAWRLREQSALCRGLTGELGDAREHLAQARAQAGQADALRAERDEVRARLVELETENARLKERENAFSREREAITAMRAEAESKFAQLAQDALSKSNESFLKLAGETLAKGQANVQGDFKANEEKLKALLKPVEDTFAKFGGKVEELERSRLRDQSALGEQIRHIGQALEANRAETGKLATALRAQPKTRGRWGEEQLRNILELAGMSAHCDFQTEHAVRDEDDRQWRPDVTLRLPGGGVLVIDAKAPMQAYLEAVDAETDAEREALLTKHAQHVRHHAKQLASKAYWDRFPQSPDFVAMFIPGENFYAAAAERDPELFQFALDKRVIIVTPASMVALAKATAFGWRQEAAAQQAQDIAQLGKQLYERMAKFGDHMHTLGKALDRSVQTYNAAVGSLETNVLPGARKFLDMNAFESAKPAPSLAPVDSAARLPAPGRDLLLTHDGEPDDERADRHGRARKPETAGGV